MEPVTVACLTASLATGEPATIPTPGTTRDAVGLGPDTSVLLVATEGPTDPEAYRHVVPEPTAP